MNFKENAKPIYLQIADRICDQVMGGEYLENERIPSVREYAALVQVNFNTVMRTYEFLSGRGIIYNKRGIGFFVSDEAKDRITTLRNETFFNDEIDYFFSRLQSIGTSPEQLAEYYINYIESHKS